MVFVNTNLLKLIIHQPPGTMIGVIRIFTVTAISALIMALVQNSIALADQANIFVLSNKKQSNLTYLQSVKDDTVILNDKAKCKIKALIEPVRVTKYKEFNRKEVHVKDRNFFCQDRECFKSWDFNFSKKPIPVDEYKNLKIAWKGSSTEKDPEINVELFLRTSNSNKVTKLIGSYGNQITSYKTLETIKFDSATYVQKNRLYTIKRELGLNIGDEWRHSYKKSELILQRIVNLPMQDLHVVKVISDKYIRPRIVQFSIDANGNGCRDDYILFEEIKPSHEIKGRKSILTIDMGPAISRKKINLNKAVLMEVIVFMPLSFHEYMQKQPLDKIEFLSSEDYIGGTHLNYKYEFSHNINTLKFNLLDNENNKEISDGLIYKMNIRTKLNRMKILEWQKIEFYDLKEEKVPAIYDAPCNALKNWSDGKDVDCDKSIISFHPVFSQVIQGPLKKQHLVYNHTPGDTFKIDLINNENKLNRIIESKWPSDIKGTSGDIYYSLSGSNRNSLIKARLITKKNKSGIPIFLSEGLKKIEHKIQGDDLIDGLELGNSIYIDKWPFQITFFDIIEYKKNDPAQYCDLEWWQKNATLGFSINGEKNSFDKNKSKVALVAEERKKNKWTFEIPRAEFVLPIRLVIPGPLPQPCQMIVQINNKRIEIPYGPYSLPLDNNEDRIKDIKITLEYFGDKPVVWMDMPEVKVIGLKRSAVYDYSRINVAIDGNKINLDPEKQQVKIGEWLNLGHIEMNKGKHDIKINNSKYFKIRSLIFETDNLLNMSNKKYVEEIKISIFKKLLNIGVKTLIFIIVCLVLYITITKLKNITEIVWKPFFRIYHQSSQILLAYIWGGVACVLYLYGFIINSANEVSYSTSLGDIAAVLFLIPFGKIIQKSINKRFPNVSLPIFNDEGSLFFAWAIVLMIITALLTATRFETFANQTAIIVFYLFTLGVVGKAIKTNRRTSQTKEL